MIDLAAISSAVAAVAVTAEGQSLALCMGQGIASCILAAVTERRGFKTRGEYVAGTRGIWQALPSASEAAARSRAARPRFFIIPAPRRFPLAAARVVCRFGSFSHELLIRFWRMFVRSLHEGVRDG
jgi:hypothetical protein